MKKNENEKKLISLMDSFADKDDTLLALFSCDDEHVGSTFTGETYKVGLAIYHMLDDGFSEDANEEQEELAFAVLFGIHKLVEEASPATHKCLHALFKILDDAQEKLSKEIDEDEDDKDEEHDFDPADEGCRECESYEDCLLKHADKIRKEREKNGE